MAYNITLIPGDGIGPEVSAATKTVLDAAGVGIEWEERLAGMTAMDAVGDVLPEDTLESIRRNKVGLKGPMTTPIGTGFRSVNVGLRQALGLYANLRPGKTMEGVQSTFDDIDLVVVRENLEGMYSGVEFDTAPPVLSGIPRAMRVRGAGRTTVRFAKPVARDAVDGDVAVSCTPASGSRFARGPTTVACSAADSSGNVAEARFRVLVRKS